MKRRILHFFCAILIGTIALTKADILELKDGTILQGSYTGGTAATVRFSTDDGIQVIETARIVALTFTSRTAPVAAAPVATPPPAAAPPPAQPQSLTIPAGTMLLVRLMDSISSKNAPGANFTTKLEYDLRAGNSVAVKGGTIVYGKVQSSSQARRVAGRSQLDIRLAQMVVNGSPAPIVTGNYKEASENSIRQAARGAAGGAAIGAIAGDAGKGAAIGATVGALRRGQTITITPGTLLEFTLMQPVTIRTGG